MSHHRRRVYAGEHDHSPLNHQSAHVPPTIQATRAPDADLENATSPDSPNQIIHLQKTLGNAAVRRLIQTGGIKNTGGAGRLSGSTATTMTTLFGDSASGAQVHTDASADGIAQGADSDATSIGNNIYFRSGAYQPGSAKGNALIAREMTHVARQNASGDRSNSQAPDSSQREEAQALGGIVETLGVNPEETFREAPDGTISRKQANILQRVNDDSHGTKAKHVAGVVTSKFLQGLGNILGPVGILWRWPLIKKNINEYTGATGKQKDKDRYGEGQAADFARFLSAFAEILKEATIWLGLATFIAAICTGASMGGAALALVILTAMTAGVAGLAALFKIYLVGHNLVRLALAKTDAEKTMIKHQLFIDGLDALSNIASALTAGFSSASAAIKFDGGSMSFSPSGGSLGAESLGYEGAVKPVVGKMINDFAISPASGVIGNSAKEGGKVNYNTDNIKDEDRGFLGGLTKDWRQIAGPDGYGKKKPTTPSTPPTTAPTGGQQAMIAQLDQQIKDISSATPRNSTDASQGKTESDSTAKLVSDKLGSFPESAVKSDQIGGQLGQTQDALKTDTDAEVEEKIDDLDEGTAVKLDVQVEEARKRADSAPELGGKVGDEGKDSDSDTTVEGEPVVTGRPRSRAITRSMDVQRADKKKPSIGNRIKGWFGQRFSGLKRGVKRLNAWLMRGVFKLMGKFNKKGANPKEHVGYVSGLLSQASQNQRGETQNAEMAAQMNQKTGQTVELYEKAKTQE